MELEKLYKAIEAGLDVRNNLIKLKIELKSSNNVRAFAYMLAGDYTVLTKLLKDEDPKVRKNVVTILGELGDDALVEVLYEAYLAEKTLYVKDAYLKAIGKLSYTHILPQLRDRRDELSGISVSAEELKHVREEISSLNHMIEAMEVSGHVFTPTDRELDVILTTAPTYVKVLKEVVGNGAKALKSGVRVKTCDIKSLLPIRIYNELLICLNHMTLLEYDPVKAANEIAQGDFLELLSELHNESGSFRYRVELRGIEDTKKEREFAKKFSKELDRLLVGEVVNDTSDYEVELRLVKNKEDKLLPFIKLMTIEDKRFSYRINTLPVSMQSYNAAIMLDLAKPYLKDDARVIDPFCGVGTLLIERSKVASYETLYGIDIFGKAIDLARENSRYEGVIINYINRDFNDFTHEHKFTEVITEMPYETAKHNSKDIKQIYNMFFDRCKELLKESSVIVMCSDELEYVQSEIDKRKEYKLLKSFNLSPKLKKYIFIISYLG